MKVIELIGLMILAGVLYSVPALILAGVTVLIPPLVIINIPLLIVIGVVIGFGFIKNFLNLCRGEKIDFLVFLRIKPMTLIYFVIANVLCGIAVSIGMVLLVVPGTILLYLFMYVPYLIVDRDMGPIAAIKESIKMSGGKHRSEIFVGLYASVLIVGWITVIFLFTPAPIGLPMILFIWIYPYMVLTGDLERVKKRLSAPAGTGTDDTPAVPIVTETPATAATTESPAAPMEA
jgi:uncharacterized membrane protein